MHGLQDSHGTLINKPWYVLTTDYDFYTQATLKCDGGHEHRQIVGLGSEAVHNTSYYPESMVKRIVQIWKRQWYHMKHAEITRELFVQCTHDEEKQRLIEEMDNLFPATAVSEPKGVESTGTREDELEPQEESPDKQTVERARAMLHKLHRAAGHPSNTNLSKLCRDRGLPKWIVQEATQLQCPACKETERGEQKILHRALGDRALPWQMIAMDAFELHFPRQGIKARYILMACVAMHFVTVSHTWTGPMSGSGTDNGSKVIQVFCDSWLMHRPKPQWVLMDSQTSFCQGIFPEFLQLVGIGSSVTAAEAHWQAGVAESLIGVIKRTMRRLRNEDSTLAPESVGALAAHAYNHTIKTHGYTPIQWAYGAKPEAWTYTPDPLEINKDQIFGHQTYADLQQKRDLAEKLCKEEQARNTMTRLLNASSRPPTRYNVGDHVFIWRSATLKARKRDESYNPEPRFIGPGRVTMVEPAIQHDHRDSVIWVLLGTTLYRCAPEQLRLATRSETMVEALKGNRVLSLPKEDLIKKLRSYVDVSEEWRNIPGFRGTTHAESSNPEVYTPEEWQEFLRRGQKREGEPSESVESKRKRQVERMKRKWEQLVSVNNNRRREGIPPLMSLPDSEDERNLQEQDPPPVPPSQPSTGHAQHHAQVFPITETAETTYTATDDIINVQAMMSAFQSMDEETRKHVIMEIEKVHNFHLETERLYAQIELEAKREQDLLHCMRTEIDKGKSSRHAWFIEFDIDQPDAFVTNNILYVKKVLESKGSEVRYDTLDSVGRALFDEAKAREVSEIIQSMALRKIKDSAEQQEAESHPERHLPMRWVLTWKPVSPPEPPQGDGPHVATPKGDYKAKARVVLIGFKHPDLIAKNTVTGRPVLQTSSPTISRLGRHTLLQSIAFDKHRLESADAKSAFLQSENQEESRRLWTRATPEVAHAMGVTPGTLMRIIGAIYGLTNAPRIFWKDASMKLQSIGAEQNPIDRCLWIIRNPQGKICGRIGSQVDDFIFGGDMDDPHWIATREKLKGLYRWSPWQTGEFIFSGCKISQSMTYSIHVSQEDFCQSLRTIEIKNDASRSEGDSLSSQELSQTRALLMKAQWRALQSAPQFCARINLATSQVNQAKLGLLREANSIIRDMKKTAKDDIVFHSFNSFRSSAKQLTYQDLIFLHWGDASHKNRANCFSTGGLITGISTPEILESKESLVSLLDWRSWRLRRISAGSNGSEGQAICESENKGWLARVLWSMMYGHKLTRLNKEELAAVCLSFLIMDSRGVYDALTGTETPGLAMENTRASVDLLSTSQGVEEGTNSHPAWVPSNLNLADSLTKHSVESWRTMQMFLARKSWVLKFNHEFVSARKAQRLKKAKEAQENFSFPDDWFEEYFDQQFGVNVDR